MIFIASTNPYMVVIVIPVLCAIAFATSSYSRHLVALKRIESAKRSPIFSLLTSTISGLAVIRCHHGKQAFIDKMHQLIDEHGQAFLLNCAANRWFATVVFVAANTFLALVVFVSLALRDKLAVGTIALSIIYALFFVILINFITMKARNCLRLCCAAPKSFAHCVL